jgi:hypothetical protein
MPPLQALLALHGLWCLGLLPCVVWAIRSWPAHRLSLGGKLVSLAAVVGFGVVIGLQAITWLAQAPADLRWYLPQRVAFVIATSPGAPLVPAALAGAVCCFAGLRRTASRGTSVAPTEAACNHVPSIGIQIGCRDSTGAATRDDRGNRSRHADPEP